LRFSRARRPCRACASTALATDLPLENYERRVLSPEGAGAAAGRLPITNLSWIDGPYFQTLRIRLKSSRAFSDVESIEPRDVVVVNERLARTFWPGQDAVGKRLRWGIDVPENSHRWLTIIGVVADVVDGPLAAEPFVHRLGAVHPVPRRHAGDGPGCWPSASGSASVRSPSGWRWAPSGRRSCAWWSGRG